jgi:hypothetical protein
MSDPEEDLGADAFGLDTDDTPIERVGRSATAEDFRPPKGKAREKAPEVGDEVAYWPAAGTSVPARVIRSAPGGRLDVAYRYRGKLEVAEGVERKAKLGGWSLPGEQPLNDEPMAGGKPIRVGSRVAFYVGRADQRKERHEGRILLRRESDGAVYILRDGFEISPDLGLDEKTLPSAPGVYLVRTHGHSRNQWAWPDDPTPKPDTSARRPGARNRSTMSGDPLNGPHVGIFLQSSRPVTGPRGHVHSKDGSTPVATVTVDEANAMLEWLNSTYRVRPRGNMAGLFNPR